MDGLKDLIPILYILGVKFKTLNMTYKTRYDAVKLADRVNYLRDKVLDDVDDYSFSPLIVSTTIWGRENEAVIHH
jgi:hypothetical protein